jgi:cytochrome c biogenesis protein CcdA
VTGAEGLAAAFIGGVLTSASPCVLAAVPVAVGFVGGQALTPRRSAVLALAFVAGMNIALLAMGLAAARLGLLLGTLPGPWSVAVGLLVVALAAWLWRSQAGGGITLPAALQQRLAASGLWGAVLLGGLIGTVMSPCATPALAAALALAGSGSAFGVSMWWGAALLLAYGIGHSLLLGVAGAMPGAAMALMRRFATAAPWLPGRRAFALLLALAGLWWVAQGLTPEWAASLTV